MKTKQASKLVGFLVLVSAWPGVAFAGDLPAWLTERRIIGNNDLEPIEAAMETDAYDKARIVARVEAADGSGFCTASRVAENLFLTNFHCYEYLPCESIVFHLGYEKEMVDEKQLLFQCVEVLAKDESLDYALYRTEFKGPSAGGGDVGTYEFLGLDQEIPDDDGTGVKQTFTIPQGGELRNIKVHVKVDHSWPGDLKLELTTPSGKTAQLFNGGYGRGDGIDTVFTVHSGLRGLLGEEAGGDWILTVSDMAPSDTGILRDVVFTITTANEASASEDGVPSDYPIATLWGGDIEVDQLLLVASHPAARHKEIDRSETCRLRTIEPEHMVGRRTITHTCDTEGGSSGSPILDRESGRIIALHWGGTDEYNLSIPMTLILDHLEANLEAEVFGELTIER